MGEVIKVVLFTVFVIVGVTCSDNTKFGELPHDMAQELKGVLQGSMKYNVKSNCTSRVRSNTHFLLYSRSNQDEAVILNITNPTQLDSGKKLVVLIHGWLSGPSTYGIIQLKNSYLKRYDCNVIVVNWSKAAWLPYSSSYCHVPPIAQYVAKALCFLKQHANVALGDVHIVGHSFGAHIAGWIGKYITTKCKAQLGRITGLDPSGMIFNDLPDNRRLDKGDAAFVDVIYTDGDRFGTTLRLGHANFYPNCGQHQPGCYSNQRVSNDTLVSDAFCSHHRSMEYMAESIVSSNFIAISCGMCPRYCRGEILSELYRAMGEDCRQEPRVMRHFYVTTKKSAPYAKGWDEYSSVSNKFV